MEYLKKHTEEEFERMSETDYENYEEALKVKEKNKTKEVEIDRKNVSKARLAIEF